ncbi:Alpha/Beta hydrolase protein [Xylariomycetidae sp. FL2044]|nr:Alpha/Beta hydrolase protein [Xylariomycetidae sp. FL2044]
MPPPPPPPNPPEDPSTVQVAGLKATDVFEPHILAQYDADVVRYVLETQARGGPAQHEVPIEEVRADPARFRPEWARDVTGVEGVADAEVVSEDGARIPVKVYRPDGSGLKEGGDGTKGCHLNFHGGGFVFGDLTSESALCLSMREADVVVVDVNYRHCPETIWGKCIQDAWAVLLWVRNSASQLGINPDSISIGGISAGGHICLVLQHLARDAGIPLKLCMATVPPSTEGLQYRHHSESPFLSFHEFYNGPILPWARLKFFGDHCFPADKRAEILGMWPSWWFAPLKAENWRGLCPTLIRTAACDPLRDEGEAYGVKLVQGGNTVTMKRYLGCPHLFMFFPWFEKKKEYDAESIVALKLAHGVRDA